MDYKNYKILRTQKEVDKLILNCKRTGYASIDFETSGHQFHSALGYPTMLGVSFQPGSGFIIPLGHFDSPFKDNYKEVFLKFSKEVLEDPEITKVAWNAKFEYLWTKKLGGQIKGRYFDAMLAKYLLNEERPNDLKSMVERYIPEYGGYEEYEGSKLPWDEKPLEGLSQYCAMDCDLTLRLMIFFENQLIKNDFYKLFRNLLMMATRVLGDSEYNGFTIDSERLDAIDIKYQAKIVQSEIDLRNNKKIKKFNKFLIEQRVAKIVLKIQAEIDDLYDEIEDIKDPKVIKSKTKQITTRESKIDRLEAGEFSPAEAKKITEEVNFNSPTQMGDLFFISPKGFKFPIVKYTTNKDTKQDTTNPSTDESVLLELVKTDKSGFCKQLLEHRGLTTLYNTFIKGIREKLSEDSKVHTTHNIHGCITGENELICKNGDIRIDSIAPKEMGVKDITDKNLFVLSHDGTWEQITHTINKGLCKTYKITTSLGETLNCTLEHKLLTIEGMKKVRDILKNNIPIIMNNVKYLDLPKVEMGKYHNEVIFKDIPGYPGYIANNEGKIFSIKIKGGKGSLDYNNPHEMLPRLTKGYLRIGFRNNDGKRHQEKVSRIVWKTFRGDIPEGYQVDHKDFNKENNHIDNLQLLSNSDNIKKNYKYNRACFTRGSINGSTKLDTLKIGNILFDSMKGLEIKHISEKYNISIKQVSRIINSEAWENIYIDNLISKEFLGLEIIYDLSVNNKHSYTIKSNYISSNTVTGRLSTTGPNLQQVPRTTTNADIKTMFIAPPGFLLLQLDYSQAELRVMAAAAGETTMIQWFKDGRDIHIMSALKKWHMEDEYDRIKLIIDTEDDNDPEFKVWKVRRKQAKTINFGIIYGQGAPKLAESLECSVEEAKGFLKDFDKQFPKVAAFVKKQHKLAKDNAYVKSVFGRKRRLPNVDSDERWKVAEALRFAINAPIQGAASDYALFSSILIWEQSLWDKAIKIELPQVYTVHDSIGYFVKPEHIHEVIPKLEAICANPETKEWFGFQIDGVKMQVDFEVSSTSWADLKTYKKEVDYTQYF